MTTGANAAEPSALPPRRTGRSHRRVGQARQSILPKTRETIRLEVVRWDKEAASPDRGSGSPGTWRSIVRWAVPHGSAVVAAVVAGTTPTNTGHGAFAGAGTWLVVSTAMYFPSLLDANGRGWHDKAADTLVVTAPNDDDA